VYTEPLRSLNVARRCLDLLGLGETRPDLLAAVQCIFCRVWHTSCLCFSGLGVAGASASHSQDSQNGPAFTVNGAELQRTQALMQRIRTQLNALSSRSKEPSREPRAGKCRCGSRAIMIHQFASEPSTTGLNSLCQLCRFHSVGLTPTYRLKTREKWPVFANPASTATSNTLLVSSRNSALACCSR
jgi:hypothetical protein